MISVIVGTLLAELFLPNKDALCPAMTTWRTP
jgi:hypothetical protein